MTTVTLAVHADGKVQELVTDEPLPARHDTYDTDGTTLLSTVPATEAEVIVLAAAAGSPPATGPRAVLSGTGAPTVATGADGDTYIDRDTNFAYGPKVGGTWPTGATVALARA